MTFDDYCYFVAVVDVCVLIAAVALFAWRNR